MPLGEPSTTELCKKICFVIPKYVLFEIGGAEIQIYFLIKEFLRRNWEVEVVCREPSPEMVIKENNLHDQRVRLLYYKQSNIRSIEFFSVLKALKQTTAFYYYQRTDYSLTGATAYYCRTNRKKMVYACAQQGDTVKGKYVEEMKSLRYSNPFKLFVRYCDLSVLDKVVEYGKRRADAVVCQTEEQMVAFKANFNRETTLINNSFEFNVPVNDHKEELILWVGNCRPVKQPELFVRLASEFMKDTKWKFVMVGKTDDNILHVIRNSELNERFILCGALPLNEVNEWYAKAKVLINTSIQEGMPNTFIQAWYYGLPVISLNVNPARLLDDGDFGVCCNGSFSTLKSELVTHMSGHIKNEGRARQYVDEHFSIEKNAGRLLKVFEQIT